MIVQIGRFRVRMFPPLPEQGVDRFTAGFDVEENVGTDESPMWALVSLEETEDTRAFLSTVAEDGALALFKITRYLNWRATL